MSHFIVDILWNVHYETRITKYGKVIWKSKSTFDNIAVNAATCDESLGVVMRNIDDKSFDLPKDKKKHIPQTLNDLSNIHLDLFDNHQIPEFCI